MTDVMPEQAVDLDEVVYGEAADPAAGPGCVDGQLTAQLAGCARAGGLQLSGEGGVLAQLTKRLVESALKGKGLTVPARTARSTSHPATARTRGAPDQRGLTASVPLCE